MRFTTTPFALSRAVSVAQVSNYAWVHAKETQVVFPATVSDWSKYDTFTFRLENKIKGTEAIQVILESPSKNAQSDAYSYLRYEIPLDFTGWRTFTIPFADFSSKNDPIGFSKIQRIKFAASGWGQEANDQNVNTIDRPEISKTASTARRASRRQGDARAPPSITVVNHPYQKEAASELLTTFAMVCVHGTMMVPSSLPSARGRNLLQRHAWRHNDTIHRRT